MSQLELSTVRLRLRQVRASDCAALTAILQEPAVSQHWPNYDRARVEAELLHSDDDTQVLAIALRDSADDEDAVIGAIQYSEESDPQYRHAGIDLFISERWQGQGIGSEAIRAVVDHLFKTLAHHRITIDPAAHNQRAIRAYQRVGFRQVGLLRDYERGPDGRFHDGLLMELLATDDRGAKVADKSAAPQLALRCARAEDVPALLPMMVAFNGFEGIDWNPQDGEAPLRKLIADDSLGYVALFGTQDAPGCGYAVITFGYDLEFGGRDSFLTELYLDPALRGQGLGRRAIELILDETRARGASALHLQDRKSVV